MNPKPDNHSENNSDSSNVGKKIANVMAIMGAASVISILIGIVRLKFIAVLLGPAGVGLYGIFLGVQNAGVALVGLGFNSSGIRQVAKSAENPERLSDIRWALIIGNLLLGVVACCVIWLLSGEIAKMVFPDAKHPTKVGLLGVGVLVSLLAGSLLAVLQGLRHIRAVAHYKILGSLIATGCGILIVFHYGMDGIIAMVMLIPAANLVVVWALGVRRLQPLDRLAPTSLPHVWKNSYALGLTFMGTTSINALSLIAIQAIIVRHGGPSEVGLFQAVFAMSVHYIGFLFLASQADYYPRLAAVSDQPRRICFLVNKQTEIGFFIAAPILILIAAMSDWILPLLYSSTFSQAVELQRLRLLGDILTIPTIFCAYVLIGLDKGSWFFITKLLGGGIYVGSVYLVYQSGFGLMGIAIAKVFMEMLILAVTTIIVSKFTGFYWRRQNIVFGLAMILSVAGIGGLAMINPLAANGVGLLLAAGFGYFALLHIYGKEKLLCFIKSAK